jgi:surfactin synthase thioesterase subunit
MLTYPGYKPVYQPKIQTPIIHVIGRYDPMTEEAQTLSLAKKCKNATVMYHPGSHYVPTKTQFLRKVTEFVEVGLGRGESDDEDEEWVDI